MQQEKYFVVVFFVYGVFFCLTVKKWKTILRTSWSKSVLGRSLSATSSHRAIQVIRIGARAAWWSVRAVFAVFLINLYHVSEYLLSEKFRKLLLRIASTGSYVIFSSRQFLVLRNVGVALKSNVKIKKKCSLSRTTLKSPAKFSFGQWPNVAQHDWLKHGQSRWLVTFHSVTWQAHHYVPDSVDASTRAGADSALPAMNDRGGDGMSSEEEYVLDRQRLKCATHDDVEWDPFTSGKKQRKVVRRVCLALQNNRSYVTVRNNRLRVTITWGCFSFLLYL